MQYFVGQRFASLYHRNFPLKRLNRRCAFVTFKSKCVRTRREYGQKVPKLFKGVAWSLSTEGAVLCACWRCWDAGREPSGCDDRHTCDSLFYCGAAAAALARDFDCKTAVQGHSRDFTLHFWRKSCTELRNVCVESLTSHHFWSMSPTNCST